MTGGRDYMHRARRSEMLPYAETARVAQAAGGDLGENFAGMGHEGDAPVVTALCPILIVVQ